MKKIIFFLILFAPSLVVGCQMDDPFGMTTRQQIRSNQAVDVANANKDAKIGAANADKDARIVEAKEDRIARETEAYTWIGVSNNLMTGLIFLAIIFAALTAFLYWRKTQVQLMLPPPVVVGDEPQITVNQFIRLGGTHAARMRSNGVYYGEAGGQTYEIVNYEGGPTWE